MKRLLWLVVVILVMCQSLIYAETLYVPANRSHISTSVLLSGVNYEFTASGTWYYGMEHNDSVLADAAWSRSYATGHWTQENRWDTAHNGLDINEQYIDWMGSNDGGLTWAAHVFNPDHVYKYNIMGNGTAAILCFEDNPSDNLGGVTVDIIPTSGPVAVPEASSLLGACIMFIPIGLNKLRSMWKH